MADTTYYRTCATCGDNWPVPDMVEDACPRCRRITDERQFAALIISRATITIREDAR